MGRRYSKESYLELYKKIRNKLGSDASITTDIIVGFPGEDEKDFEETLSLAEECKFDSAFTFIYSPREGTPAAKMDDPVPYEEKSRWFKELTDLQETISAAQMKLHEGKTYKCYVYGKGIIRGNSILNLSVMRESLWVMNFQ